MEKDELEKQLGRAIWVIRVLVILVIFLALVAGYLWTVEQKRKLVESEFASEMQAEQMMLLDENKVQ